MTDALPHLHIVLLCDEGGSRLWPLVPDGAPACLAPAAVGSDESLLSQALQRVRQFTERPIHLVTTRQYAAALEDELLSQPALADCDVDMLVQPQTRGSAFAVALIAARIRRHDPSAVVAVFPSDQRVEADDRWPHLVYRAYLAALQEKVAVIGTQQKAPCQGNTFIRIGAPLGGLEDTFEVRQFSVDAPSLVARRAQREGAAWFTGIVCARAAVLMGEMAFAGQYGKGEEARGANRIAETATFFAELGIADLLKKEAEEVVAVMPYASLERSVLATSERLAVLPSTLAFTTVDSLDALERVGEPDASANRLIGPCTAVNSKNVTAYCQDSEREVVLLGMQDCVVVDTGHVLLIANKGHLGELGDVAGASTPRTSTP